MITLSDLYNKIDMNTLYELINYQKNVTRYQNLIQDSIDTFFISDSTKTRIKNLRSELQQSYSRLESEIIRYGGRSYLINPSSGKKQNVFELAFRVIDPFNAELTLNALDDVLKILNNAIGKLQKEGDSWNYSTEEIINDKSSTFNEETIELFYSFAEEDEDFKDDLEKHLSILRRQKILHSWNFRMITGGTDWRGKIDFHLTKSQIILLLISPDFLNSDYCYDIEMKKALDLHMKKIARVVPVILRPVDWKIDILESLQALPKNGKAITRWADRDEAFYDVAKGIKLICKEIKS